MAMGPGNGDWARYGPGDLTPGERLARRRLSPAKPATDEERDVGRLPASGQPHDSISLKPDRDYPADSDLCFGLGNSETRVRLTPGDQEKARAVLAGALGCDLGELKDRAAGYMRVALDEVDPDIAEWASRNADLAVTACAVGYRLAVEDQVATAQDAGYVRDFLAGLLERAHGSEVLANGEVYPGPDVRALERVIAMLRREGK
jgi:hypothetical protein